MPADVIARICAAERLPPSNFTASAPVAFMTRTADSSACCGPASYEPNGRSTTTNARVAAPATARAGGIMSSIVTGSVVACPCIVFPIESPTSSMSTPASSKIRAVTASYAVSIVSRSPRSFAARRWCTRTRLMVSLIVAPFVRPADVGSVVLRRWCCVDGAASVVPLGQGSRHREVTGRRRSRPNARAVTFGPSGY